MLNRPLDGPSAQLLADGTRSIHVLVPFLASAAQKPLMSHALSLVGLVPLMRPNLAASLPMYSSTTVRFLSLLLRRS